MKPAVDLRGLVVEPGQASSAGRKSDNEDCIGIRLPEGATLASKGVVAVIADGVSAAEAGREASHTCVTNFLSDYFATPDSWAVKQAGQQIMVALNRWLYGRGQRYLKSDRGYVSTLTVLIIKGRRAHIFHVGDSRVYRLRDGELQQLTRDHSVQVNGDQTYLARAMGMDAHLEVDYLVEPVCVGDRFLLSTDGVHDFVAHESLLRAMAQDTAPELICSALNKIAIDSGSDDNVSCQLLRIDQLPDAAATELVGVAQTLPFAPDLERGHVLDGYRVEQLIHASSRSQLYRVVDTATGEALALKTPSVNFSDDPAYIESFALESWIGRRINSPYILRVKPGRANPSCLYTVSELVRGRTLDHWLARRGAIDINSCIDLIEQVGRGVQALHRRDTVHRDLKPDNIMIDDQGRIKIIDLGACYIGGVADLASTRAGEVHPGTATWSAPEVKGGHRPEPASDQFSLAAIAFVMLTGVAPFAGKLEQANCVAAAARLTYIPAYHYNPHVPVWMDEALRRALASSPRNRYPDVMAFCHDLRHPNPQYLAVPSLPLAQRNPVRFWQLVAGALLLVELFTLAKLL